MQARNHYKNLDQRDALQNPFDPKRAAPKEDRSDRCPKLSYRVSKVGSNVDTPNRARFVPRPYETPPRLEEAQAGFEHDHVPSSRASTAWTHGVEPAVNTKANAVQVLFITRVLCVRKRLVGMSDGRTLVFAINSRVALSYWLKIRCKENRQAQRGTTDVRDRWNMAARQRSPERAAPSGHALGHRASRSR